MKVEELMNKKYETPKKEESDVAGLQKQVEALETALINSRTQVANLMNQLLEQEHQQEEE